MTIERFGQWVLVNGTLAALGALVARDASRLAADGARPDGWRRYVDYKVPLVMTPQPEGGYTVTSPLLPELVTEGDSICDALENVKDALAAVVELYEELGRALPQTRGYPTQTAPYGLRP